MLRLPVAFSSHTVVMCALHRCDLTAVGYSHMSTVPYPPKAVLLTMNASFSVHFIPFTGSESAPVVSVARFHARNRTL